MGKRATMTDIANHAGVSQATVSLVLNEVENARVGAATRQRVLEAADALGYRKTQRLHRSPTGARVIGLLIDDVTTTPFAAQFIEGARDEAALHDCIVAVFCTRRDEALEEAALDLLAATQLQGVVYAALVTQGVTPPERLKAIPTISLNCHDGERRFPAVLPGDVAGAFAATEALLKAGHRRIAHLAGESWMEAARDRELGYRRALASWDVPVDPDLILAGGFTVTGGRDLTAQLLALPEPPTALFCFNDRMAVGACDAIRNRGLRVPDDLSVMGYDDEDLVRYLQPPLSSVVLPHDEMARWAVGALFDGAVIKAERPVRMKMDCPLALRQSIAPPRALARGDVGPSVGS
ncbi:LacI family DNA-binding transcriptional regulator [Devosia sp. 1635]|uniref:LacI family DNA-binding transcriptional regulator n=1 Tax=Devosia sp. 1635 TaxID=2726066 RepID=UPI0015631B8F|nr:LacI family DNA-binding transcriptional regulator [Devosia sp. 1635]